MPTLRSRSAGAKSSPVPPSRAAAAPVSNSTTPTGSLGEKSKGNLLGEPSSVINPLTPGGDREHAHAFGRSSSRPQTRAAAAAGAGPARKTRQRLGNKVLFADQKQEDQREEGAAAAEIPVMTTRRTSKRVQGRGGGLKVDRVIDTQETAAAVALASTTTTQDGAVSPPSAMEHGNAMGDKGKRKAVAALSDSDEEDDAVVVPGDSSDAEEAATRRIGSRSVDVAGDGSARGVQSPRTRRRPLGPSITERNSNPPNAEQTANRRVEATKAKFLEVARRRAAHFAHFDGEKEDPAGSSAAVVDEDAVVDEQRRRAADLLAQVSAVAGHRPDNGEDHEDQWHGPFVIARQLVEGRESAAAARHETIQGLGPRRSSVEWRQSRKPGFSRARIPTSLHDMCVEVLCANIEHVTSLTGVTDGAKKKIAARLCARRIMTPNALRLYFLSEPGEVVIPDCTFATEETLTEALASCSTSRLEVLELGLCGRALSDQLCASTLGGFPCSLPTLHTLVLNGAYRLTDIGLKTLVSGAPKLTTLILKQCNMISAAGLETVAHSIGKTLKTLSLESCNLLDPLRILPPLLKMSSLESLSLSGVHGMSDGIIIELAVILGQHLRELYIADCKALTDVAISAISMCCRGLKLLDMGHLPMLTDSAIGSLADGCRDLSVLRLDRGKFSDTTLAALVTASGKGLTELSLNSVRQAGDLTVSALAKHSKRTLEKLDLSFCRTVSDEGLGLLADACEGLREIRLFGCTQVTQIFVEGHSNAKLDVIGLADTLLDFSCPALQSSRKVL